MIYSISSEKVLLFRKLFFAKNNGLKNQPLNRFIYQSRFFELSILYKQE
jgi:hypothetical protein